MRYAAVAVTCRTSRAADFFSYTVPAAMQLGPGSLVWVPFGQRLVQGVVLALSDEEPPLPTKEVAAVADPLPVLTPAHLALARWIAAYYCCPLSAVVAQMLPAELRRKAMPVYSLTGQPPADLSPRGLALATALAERPRTLAELLAVTPGREGYRELRSLVQRGLIARTWALGGPRIAPKIERTACLSLDEAAVPAALRALSRAPRQAAALRWLVEHAADGRPVPLQELCRRTGATPATLTALAQHGYLSLGEREVRRDPLAGVAFPHTPLPVLTPRQSAALAAITSALRQGESRVFLLHGVTGSGKGEIYLHALTETIRLGRQAIVLVPEIALTPQTISRFASRFGGRVAVLHSRLSPGEHYDEWRRIRQGEAAVVIGSRSAIFAPLAHPGLIVVDEEHEWSYKQTDRDPRYHAREAAIALGQIARAVVVLGSATPDIATYYRAAERQEFTLLELPERIAGGRTPKERPATAVPAADRAPAVPPTIPLPAVQIVDLRAEASTGAGGVFSRLLRRSIAEALADGSQVILYLNRRGTATLIMCKACGYVARCRRCEVPLVYHADRGELLCHHCNRAAPAPQRCPECWAPQLGYFGLGTQRVEVEAKRLFPAARVVRWDSDSTRGRAANERIWERFLRREADILVGTQMVAKGLDLPQVALVGVVLADVALQLPDFRAAERTFQLLMQVAGRAGRGARPGKVIIQTYNPQHYAVQAASLHDYRSFYEQEAGFRAAHRYPPFADLARLVYQHTSEQRCRQETEQLAAYLRAESERRGLPEAEVIGPAPAYRQRVRGRHRWHIILRGADVRGLVQDLPLPPGWALDVDPISLL